MHTVQVSVVQSCKPNALHAKCLGPSDLVLRFANTTQDEGCIILAGAIAS